ncbi:MAG: hypothetical protein ABIO44_12765, partial [Saprospiraceae bacterium]
NIFLSQDDGKSWNDVTKGLPSSPNGPAYSSASLDDEYYYVVSTDSGLYKSRDNGLHWSPSNNGSIKNGPLYVDPNNSIILVTTGTDRIYYSYDKGDSWEEIIIQPKLSVIGNLYYSNGMIYVGSWRDSLYKTKDFGMTWSKVLFPDSSDYRVRILNSNKNILLATSSHNLYISLNWGDSWKKILNTIASGSYYSAAISDSNIFLSIQNSGIWVSSDLGNSWTRQLNGLPVHVEARDIWFQNNKLYATIYGSGVYISGDEGKTWDCRSDGLIYKKVNTLHNIEGKLIAGAGSSGNFNYDSKNDKWSRIKFINDSLYINAKTKINDSLIIATNQGIFISGDAGLNWINRNSGLNDLNILDIKSNKNTLYCCSYNQVYKSIDNGNSWNVISPTTCCFTQLAVLDSLVFALGGIDEKWVFILDNPSKYQIVNSTLSNTNIKYSIINYKNKLYLGARDGLYSIEKMTNNWQVNLINPDIKYIFNLWENDKLLFAASYFKLYVTDDVNSWEDISEEINETFITCMEFDGNKIFVGTANPGIEGKGVWYRDISNLNSFIVPTVSRFNIYPNPSHNLIHFGSVDYSGSYFLQLISSDGKILFTNKYEGVNSVTISIIPGLYYYRFLNAQYQNVGSGTLLIE